MKRETLRLKNLVHTKYGSNFVINPAHHVVIFYLGILHAVPLHKAVYKTKLKQEPLKSAEHQSLLIGGSMT